MKRISFLLVIIFLIISSNIYSQEGNESSVNKNTYTDNTPYQTVKVNPVKGKKVKNVILMIGDGMGLVQVSSAWVANRGHLNLDNFTYTGFSRTYCANKLITDSGAGGTALSTGHKTNYHSVGVSVDGTPLPKLTELATKKGLKTAVVVTCNLPDATPADFCTHCINRDNEEEIAADYLNCNVDYIFGAGRERFNKRSDGRDILNEMKQKGYHVCTTWDETSKVTDGKVFSVISEGQLPLAPERGDLFEKACMQSLGLLNRGNKGFFAMLEGSRIDDCGHWNDMPKLIEEVQDFDKTIGMVLQWAEKDGQTLVIVIADHETGGLSLLDGDIKTGTVTGFFSTHEHSGIAVPVYAYGPGAENFTGIYENTDVFNKIVRLLNINK